VTAFRETRAADFSVNGHGPDLEPPHPTDMGNAARFARDHRGQALYVPERGKWFLWDGRRWALDHGHGVIALAKATVRGICAEAGYTEDAKERRALAEHAMKSEQEARLRATVFLAPSEPGMTVSADELDRDPYAFNVMNGTVDLGVGALRMARREDLITKVAPVAFDPEAPCPRWEAFLVLSSAATPS
jgi:putative DNA primase/helicase